MKLPWLLISGGIKKFGSRTRPRAPSIVEAVVGDRGLDRRVLVAPIGQQPVEPDRIDHRAGEDMGADLGALLDHDDRDVRRELLEPDRGGKPRRPGADDDDVELHRFAGGQFGCTHEPAPNWPAPDLACSTIVRERAAFGIGPSYRR